MTKRFVFVVLLTLYTCWLVAPTVIYFVQPLDVRNKPEVLKQKIPSWLPSSHIKLGLDLQGGVQLVLGVNTSGAVDNKLSRIATETVRWAKEAGQPVKNAFVVKGKQKLRIELEDNADINKFKEAFHKEFYGLKQADHSGNGYDFTYDDAQMTQIKKAALEQAERVIRSRIDEWGVTEPQISRRVDGSVLVQLPGFSDPEKAKELLGRTAQLKFKIVDDSFTGLDQIANNLPENITAERGNGHVQLVSEDKDAILNLVKPFIPEDHEVLLERELIAGGKKSKFISYVVFASTELSGEDVLDAGVTSDSTSLDQHPAVSLKFTGPGGKRFAEVTGANVQKRMAIVLDDTVISAPVIQTKIAGGNAVINLGRGNYQEKYDEANQLSLILKSGALPATIEVLEERQVGASLGPELAQQGIYAILVGLSFVLVYMAIYYRKPGLVACIALILNGLYMLALMAAFGFALTLPGIAGFILTLGMAVDANVLINERIRQELNEGRGAKKAVANAFDRVFWTIVDANVTTLIAALVLLETSSSGPVRGFAVTLIIGLSVSIFTSLYCTKLFFNMVLGSLSSDTDIRKWFGASAVANPKPFNFNFMRWSKPAVMLGVLIGLGVIGVAGTRGFNWSVDFVGGTEMEIAFSKDIEPKKIREVAEKVGIDQPLLQALEGTQRKFLLRFDSGNAGKADMQTSKTLQTQILDQLKDYNPEVLRIDFVGPQIGKELRNQGILSVLFSLIGILAYVALRFDLRFGPSAIIKMIQDVTIVMGFYIFFYRSFDLTSVAALLTVIGYSVNDVIVIYDRIRENMANHPKRVMLDNINISLNETLGRSLNTSLVTIISLIGVLVFGTAQIWDFAAAMTVGVFAATFTSTFLASACVLWTTTWQNKSRGKVATT